MTRRWQPVAEAAIEEIEAALLTPSTLHVDETSLRVKGTKQWVHVASTSKETRYGIHRLRGKQAADDIGILPRYKGTMVHDAYAVYPMYTQASHALCHAHHLRELREYTELYHHSWKSGIGKRCTTSFFRMGARNSMNVADKAIISVSAKQNISFGA